MSLQLLNDIKRWIDHHPQFDASFVRSLDRFHKKTGFLTDNQKKALQNIYTKWKIRDWIEANGTGDDISDDEEDDD